MPEEADEVAQSVDHIVARQHHGTDDPDNLALACLSCNLHKGPNIAGIDPDTGQLAPLFHPRRDHWDQHFRWNGARLIGLTPTGRVTVDLLAINDERNVVAREALIAEGRFPSDR
jgi:hypothetical protein